MGIFGVIALVVNIVSALARIARAMPMWRARTTTPSATSPWWSPRGWSGGPERHGPTWSSTMR